MEIFFGLFFVVWIFVFCFIFINIFKSFKNNKNAPTLEVSAEVVDKEKTTRKNSNNMHHSTFYYVSFKVKSGDVIKLCVPSDVYNYLFVGDYGLLEFKGTKFLGFRSNDKE